MKDSVNSPEHYNQAEIECIDAIRAALTPEEFRGFCKGNIIKYVWREKRKGQDESIAKAVWYANEMVSPSGTDWMPWEGTSVYGPLNPDYNGLVHVKCRSGITSTGLHQQFAWRHNNTNDDIIAYRAIK